MMSPRGAVGDEPWLEICELTAGQYFGERALLDGRRNAEHTASVVTITRAEILILSKYDFYRNIDERTQELMREYAGKFYFDEDKIRRTITKQHRWDSYKKDVMREALSPRHSEGGAAGR
jgi:CRP-like cAMP-binding protein